MPHKFRKSHARLLAIAMMSCPVFCRAAAPVVTWSNPAGGSFHEASNWNSGAGPAPGASDDAQFNLAGSYTTTFSADATTSLLTVGGSDVTLAADGSPRTYTAGELRVDSGSLTLGGTAAPLTLNVPDVWAKVAGGANLSITNGNQVTVANGIDIAYATFAPPVNTPPQISNFLVDGAGSAFSAPNLTRLGNLGGVANVTFANNAIGNFNTITTGGGANNNTAANFTVQSGADVTVQGYLTFGLNAQRASQSYSMLVTGAGSTLTQHFGALQIGGTTVGTSTLTITNGGSVTTAGSHGMTIYPTGVVDYTGGTLTTPGGILVAGGTIKSTDATGTLNWANVNWAGLHVREGGVFDYFGSMTVSRAIDAVDFKNIFIDDPNSRFITSGLLTLEGSRVSLSVTAGGSLRPASLIVRGAPGTLSAGVTVDGAGSSLITGDATIGGDNGNRQGRLTIRNSATATFSGVLTLSTGTQFGLAIESDADVIAANINLAGNAILNLSGAGSTLTQSGASTFSAGGLFATGKVTVSNGATFNSGAGQINIASGADINGGTGTINLNGNVSMSGGNLTRFNLAAGKTLNITGGFATSYASATFANNVITVSGPFAQLGSETMRFEDGTVATYQNGAQGNIINLNVGAAGGGGTLTITGANSRIYSSFGTNSNIGAASGSPATLNVNDGGILSPFGGGTLTVKPTGTININNGILAGGNGDLFGAALTIDGGRVNLNAGALEVFGLSIVNGGKLDVTTNAVNVSASIGAWDEVEGKYTGVLGMVQAGRDGGTWNGTGIITSGPDALTGLTTLGVAQVGAKVKIMYTLAGDADLSGIIDADDFFAIDSHYNDDPPLLSYATGDFNYDGTINGDDYFLIDQSFNSQFAAAITGVSPVPEPAGLAAIAIGLLSLRRRRLTNTRGPFGTSCSVSMLTDRVFV